MPCMWKEKRSLQSAKKEDLIAVRDNSNKRVYDEDGTKRAYEEYFRDLFTHIMM